MTNEMYRIGIVGASSLVGKELSEALGESLLAASDVVLLDGDESAGQMTATGDEVSFIQRLEPSAFERLDFVFFAGDPATTKKHWQDARRAGASIVDMTYALAGEKEVLVRSPWVTAALAAEKNASHKKTRPDLNTHAVVAAHPAAVMMALVAARLREKLPLSGIAATVMEPASEHGRAAMDELHQQTVSLLSFQGLPREQYDAQVAFNLLAELGESAAVKLTVAGERIQEHYQALADEALPSLSLQIVQAPVFHGYTMSLVVDFAKPVSADHVASALNGDHIDVVGSAQDSPSNLNATGRADIMVRVGSGLDDRSERTRLWLWMAADNLKLMALNALECAAELQRLRPLGKVQ